MNNTTWLGSAAVALVLGVTAAVAQNPAASDKRGDSPQAQAPAKSERADDRQKERSAQDNDSRSGAKDAQAPSRDDKAGQKQAQEPRDESRQPARQSQEQDRTQRPPANAQRQDREQDQKQARQPSDQKDAKQPEQKDAKQPADSRQQQTRDQQKQDSNRAAESKDDAKKPQQQSQQPAPAKAPTNQAAQPAPANPPTNQAAQPAPGTNTAQDRQNQPATGQAATQQGGSSTTTTQISEQQRTQVRETLSRDRTTIARENQNLNIQVNVGVALPANVRARSLPPDIVRIAPQYRGYEYTVVEDEIVIIEPRTRRVVEVLEEPGRARQSTSRISSTSRQVLTDDQRQTLRQSVQRPSTTGSTASSGGLDANCLTLQNLPDEMARANPDLRNYKMLTIGQQLVLVDPQQQTVVEVID